MLFTPRRASQSVSNIITPGHWVLIHSLNYLSSLVWGGGVPMLESTVGRATTCQSGGFQFKSHPINFCSNPNNFLLEMTEFLLGVDTKRRRYPKKRVVK